MIVVILSKPGRLGLGMHVELHLAISRLHVGAVDHRVGELLEAALALEEQDRHAEFHAELGLQLVRGPMVDQRVGHVAGWCRRPRAARGPA
jgi:hypothetical protein